MAIKATGVLGETKIPKVDPRQILVNESNNYRQEYGDISTLAKNISANGLLMPLRVRKTADGTLELVSGYRRMRAIMSIIAKNNEAFPFVSAIVEGKGISDEEILLHNLATNEGLRPTPLEECEAYTRLKNWGMNNKTIAQRVGRSTTHVSNVLKLQNASSELKAAVASKAIGSVAAQKIVDKSNGSIVNQSIALDKAKKTKAAKKAKKAADKAANPKPPPTNKLGMATPAIPGMSAKPKTKPDKYIRQEVCDLEYLKQSLKDEFDNYKESQDTTKLQAQIDDLVDLLNDFREGLV